jgi:arylsulfatase A
VSDELVNGTDFLPTLCELAEIEVPADRTIDGTSMVPAFKGQHINRDVPACWIFPAGYTSIPHIAMREKNYVILGWFNSRGKNELWMDYIKTARIESFELYNLKEDVTQSKNLVNKDPQRFKDMADKMKILWKEIQAEGPVWREWESKDNILHMVEQRATLSSGKE